MYMTNEKKEYEEILRQMKEINLDELLMNTKSMGSTPTRSTNTNNLSSSKTILTTTKQSRRTTQPLQQPTSYEFTSYLEHNSRIKRGNYSA